MSTDSSTCSGPRAQRSESCTGRRAQPCSAIRPRRTGYGRCSTGTSRDGPPSWPIPKYYRSSNRRVIWANLSQRRCSAPTEPEEPAMTSSIDRPARVGVITDQTGALSFMGIANVNVANMVIDDINSRGGLLGRPVELFIEDSATDDLVAETVASKLVNEVQVDVALGGIYSSTRQAIKGPVVDKAETLYIYPEQYEGQESHPLIFC